MPQNLVRPGGGSASHPWWALRGITCPSPSFIICARRPFCFRQGRPGGVGLPRFVAGPSRSGEIAQISEGGGCGAQNFPARSMQQKSRRHQRAKIAARKIPRADQFSRNCADFGGRGSRRAKFPGQKKSVEIAQISEGGGRGAQNFPGRKKSAEISQFCF